MQRSASIRAELEDAVAGMSPAARAVYEDTKRRNEAGEPKFPEDFDALTPIERTRVTKAGELLKGLAEAEAAEDAGDQERSKGDSRRHRQLWIASVLISLACLVAVVGISVSVRTAPTTPDPADTVVTTQDEVTRYLAAHVPAPVRGAEPPVFIPTGLYIQSVEFTGPYTLEVSGQIWQRYANDLPEDITKGVFLPDVEEQPTLKEVYRERLGDEEVTAWNFHASLREQFNYSRYPLGRHQIKLRMWHPDYARNVYLTPDFGAYASTDRAAMPGVNPDLVLELGHSASILRLSHPSLQYGFWQFRLRNESIASRAVLQHRRQKEPGNPFYIANDRAARDPGSALYRRNGAQQRP